MADVPEYKTLAQCSQKLRIVIRGDLDNLSARLLATALISHDAYNELINTLIPESERAARLVAFIMNKVRLDPRSYYTFIDILSRQESPYYSDILRILHETYSNFKGMFQLHV